ncbi:MAG: hypothetical protein WCY12_02090, partial [Candidatus Omnitrophota bacterium]
MKRIILFISFFCLVSSASAEVVIIKNDNLLFSFSPYLRTDAVVLKNNNSLDSHNKDDSSAYLGIDYSLAFDLKLNDGNQEAHLKFERNGPYDYDAPLFIHNTLITSTAPVERYRNKELLPHLEEFWYDLALFKLPLRFKSGLFSYDAGNNVSTPSDYENFSLRLYSDNEGFNWQFYYCRPELVNKSF